MKKEGVAQLLRFILDFCRMTKKTGTNRSTVSLHTKRPSFREIYIGLSICFDFCNRDVRNFREKPPLET